MATFEERLRQLRKEKGLCQKELAEALNVANTTVSIWERGLRKPEMDTLEKVRNYFDVSLAYLLGENTGERAGESSVTFAQRLKELRVERGLTQEELAEKLGVTKNTIFVWEKGQRFPDDEWATYNELSIIFDVSYGYIAGDTDDREEHLTINEEIAAEEALRLEREYRRTLGRMYRDLSPEMQQMVGATIRSAYDIDKQRGHLLSQQEEENNREENGDY